MKIYLCSRYSRRLEMVAVAAELRKLGHEITSRWILGEHEALDGKASPAMRQRFAEEDIEDLRAADRVICFTEVEGSPYGRGGRHWEAGAAYMLGKGITIVGPPENVFYELPGQERYTDWATCFSALLIAAAERDGNREVAVDPGRDEGGRQPAGEGARATSPDLLTDADWGDDPSTGSGQADPIMAAVARDREVRS